MKDWISIKNVFNFAGYAKLRCIDNNIRRPSSVISEVKTVVHGASDSDDDHLHGEASLMRTKGSM